VSRDQHDTFGEEFAEDRGLGPVAIAAVVLIPLAVAGWFFQDQLFKPPVPLAASQGRLTLAEAGGERPAFDPRESPEIWYRVLLDSAPSDRRLHLVGEWLDPAGRVAQRNTYDTKPITQLPWETHVRFRLPADAAPGTWRVRLLAEGRELHAMPFEVGTQVGGRVGTEVGTGVGGRVGTEVGGRVNAEAAAKGAAP